MSMSAAYDDFGQAARRLRVDTLVRLRWIAVFGQAAAVVGVYFVLNFDFPVGQCMTAIATSATLNFALRLGTPASHRLSDTEATILLCYDILQLAVLLYLTGGVVNSFSMLFLAPVMIAAVSLPRNMAFFLGVLMIAAAVFITVEYEPLPWRFGDSLSFPLLYRLSFCIALGLSALFIAVYAGRVSDESRKLAAALAATELVLERAQHLSQLDGLAAAAAHELGTPLATITLTIKELQRAVAASNTARLGEDLTLLEQEARRCRDILRKLNSLDANRDDAFDRLSLESLVDEVVDSHGCGLLDPEVDLQVVKIGIGPQPTCPRNPGILFGLGNLVENALDFARSAVRIELRWSVELVVILIEDDGPGFAPAILDRLGDPYLRSHTVERRTKSEPGSGLGLGLFIAKTLLERSGALMEISNVEAPRSGARIVITWQRAAFAR